MLNTFIRRSEKRDTGDTGQYSQDAKGIRLAILHILNILDLVVYTLVGMAFVAAAMLAFIFSVSHLLLHFDLVLPMSNIAQDVLDFVSDLLLVIIIMELLFTIRSYVEKGDTSVEPFLIIGIISATRGILSIGARLYIGGTVLTTDEFRSAMIELAVNALVIIVLGFTIRILGGSSLHQDSRAKTHLQSQTDTTDSSSLGPSALSPRHPE
ncbi:MAG TPA: phosphate-starvation-inducible PsiE family protein [Ktedonobacterales bacterium]|nr:phosphate-starvation-inducible PsiE family protein [Ktedonobacterales bacterium]